MTRFSREWWADVLVGPPLRILLVLVIAVVARWLVHRAVDRLVDRVRNSPTAAGRAPTARRVLRAATAADVERELIEFLAPQTVKHSRP